MHTVIKVCELALWQKFIVFFKCCRNVKTSLFVLFNFKAESMNCFLFLKNLDTHCYNVTSKKNFVKINKSLPKHLSEKFVGNNSSIIDIALKN